MFPIRIGEEVFWTRHKVNLPKGETVVSDGARLARTRCGNRFSEIPQLPTSAKEPSSEILEAALEPAFVNLPEEAITFPQSFDHPLRAAEFADTSVTPSVPPIWWVPIIPIGPLTPLPPGPPPVTPPENPPVNIPEAGTGTLLIFGMLLVGIARGWRWWPKRS